MIKLIEKQLRNDIEIFNPGDEVRVEIKTGKEKSRVQAFEGLIISKKGEGINRTFTVRKYSFGIGVEKIFPMHSPLITGIKILRRGKVRRAKLYYMRSRYGKAARIKEKRQY